MNIITYCNRKPGDGWSTEKRLSTTASRKGRNMGRKVREKLTLVSENTAIVRIPTFILTAPAWPVYVPCADDSTQVIGFLN